MKNLIRRESACVVLKVNKYCAWGSLLKPKKLSNKYRYRIRTRTVGEREYGSGTDISGVRGKKYVYRL